ncbi:uncharacterized protein MYCFIDRAFT_116137, partial [Pseudocercospora fijiensis CIRAD86]
QSEADRVLETIKERRRTAACYPCAKRKVRCSGGQPCATCSQRNHPDICFYHDGKRPNKRKRETDNIEHGASPGVTAAVMSKRQAYVLQQDNSSPSAPLATPASSHADRPQSIPRRADPTTLGSSSIASFLEDRLQNARPGLGLQNHHSVSKHQAGLIPTVASYASSDLIAISPQRSEVFRFFPFFRSNVVPFILKDGDSLELSIFTFLSDFESAQAKDEPALRTFTETQRNRISVYLASLALGAQMSDMPAAERARYADDFALLMLGMCFQNSGSSDASWSLLGLTFRLAQSLGLHNPPYRRSVAVESAVSYSYRKSIIWQDALLSLRFGRTPLQTAYDANNPESWLPSHLIDSFVDAMHALNAIGLAYMSSSEPDRTKVGSVRDWIAALEMLRERLPPYLKSVEGCSNLQQTLQYYALRMHMSFLEAEMCRPCMIRANSDNAGNFEADLSERALRSMQTTVSAYLSMSRLSVLPLRNWSLIQESLSCACVLALLKACRNNPGVQSLLDQVIQLL